MKTTQPTISRELKRNGKQESGEYDLEYAKHIARVRKKDAKFEWKKIRAIPELERYIIRGLKGGRSPKVISGRMKRLKKPWYASKTAIYEWLYSSFGRKYCKYLFEKRIRRKKIGEKKTKKVLIPNRVSIHERPELLGYADYEADTVVSGKSTKSLWALVTITNIRLGYIDVRKVPNLKPDIAAKGFQSMLDRLQNTETITFDNGQENRSHEELEALHFFCDPYSSWQKPYIENANKLIRRYIPKGSDIGKYSDEYIRKMVKELNNLPRERLDYMTPNECMRKHKLFRKTKKPH